MSSSNERPAGVNILGLLHVVGGYLGIVALVAWFVWAFDPEGKRSGLPLELLIGIALYALVGPVLGSALRKGRSWAWYVALFAYVLTAVVGWFVIPKFLTAVRIFEPLVEHARVLAGIKIAVAALLAFYLLTRSVVDFFGVKRGTRWIAFVVEVGLAAGVLFGIQAVLERFDSGPAGENVSLLHEMGERRANSEEDVRLMLEMLEDGTMEERASAAWALGRSGRGDVMPQVLEAAREDRDVNVRINAIGAVAVLGGKDVQNDLVAFLADRELEVRSAALRGLADKRFAGAVEEVGEFLLENESLRAAAVDALGNMESTAGVPVLLQVASDPQEDVRSRVAYALGRIGDGRAVPQLTEMLEDQRWEVRANAAQSLGMIGDPATRPALAAMRDDPNSQVRHAVQAALDRLP